jgi:hypothetical protein
MKVKIGNYKNYFGPYQLAEVLCFWTLRKYEKPDYVEKLGEWLAHGYVEPEVGREVGKVYKLKRKNQKGTIISNFLVWVDDKRERTIKVKLDSWDTYSADHTLAYIILPVLQKLKEDDAGIPMVSDEDVPEELRSTNAGVKANQWDLDDNAEARWEWILNEMIFAFESKVNDGEWEDQFYTSGTGEIEYKHLENGNVELLPDTRLKVDREGLKSYQDRITNGFMLFGKYYESLWT